VFKHTLFILPARAGSKGLSKKNTKPLNGIPLILYALNYARKFVGDAQICVSTNDAEVIAVCNQNNYHCLFSRPEDLSNDGAGMSDVIRHALQYYEHQNHTKYENIVLLQPTSPFRKKEDLLAMMAEFSREEIDMICTVHESKGNPYFNLVEDTSDGLIQKSKSHSTVTRQSSPKVWMINGNLYILNANSINTTEITNFKRLKKHVIDIHYSVDIDNIDDWNYALFLLEKQLINDTEIY
jgi:CMP-N,N'-diacetyllegionaminic acid synthase